MESGIISFVKNGFDWLKEGISFLLLNESRIKTISGVNNLIILISKHQSHKREAFLMLKSIFSDNNKSNKYYKKTKEIKKELQKTNSGIGYIASNNEILYVFNYFNDMNLKIDKITTEDIYSFLKKTNGLIISWQKNTRIFALINIILGISLF